MLGHSTPYMEPQRQHFIWYWFNMVASTEEAVDPDAARTEGFRQDIQRLASYFYANDDLLTSTQAEQLQQAF